MFDSYIPSEDRLSMVPDTCCAISYICLPEENSIEKKRSFDCNMTRSHVGEMHGL